MCAARVGYNRRMTLATTARIAALALLVGVAGTGCSHEARPVAQPEEPPPLPPASGTPLGHLVDAAPQLRLSDDQLHKLQAIADDLAGQLAADDGELRPEPTATTTSEPKARGFGMRAGGRGPGESGGQVENFPGAPQGGTREVVISAATVNHVNQQRAHHVRDAIRRALALLDADQQAAARRVLADHGIDPDTGEVSGDDPGAAKLPDPKLGQPLPREP